MKPSTAPDDASPKPRRFKRILKRVIFSLIIIFILLVYGVLPLWFSSAVTNARTRASDRQQTETPADYRAQFKEVEFQTSDGVRISGWLMPSRGKRARSVSRLIPASHWRA